ncbi:Spo0E family sporulation regulatory protein-aspartic acid phosphatase [Clostridium bovifaecis]|uniref:Spo0E family sporulation regulatory protein-aspartic acid phosphatase n=1 Tax=Clostridium bovifaecis TaxID=2184719 RepID=A0A6I6F5K6_9CLOT|nr:Spo0E family sporulation regulatory protein-aspartic acid phosphatase [Clostridium bovifaecis]
MVIFDNYLTNIYINDILEYNLKVEFSVLIWRRVMENIRERLNRLIEDESISLCSGEALKLSQELDKLIYGYYKNQKEKVKKPMIA